jgi:hypothetical protein
MPVQARVQASAAPIGLTNPDMLTLSRRYHQSERDSMLEPLCDTVLDAARGRNYNCGLATSRSAAMARLPIRPVRWIVDQP